MSETQHSQPERTDTKAEERTNDDSDDRSGTETDKEVNKGQEKESTSQLEKTDSEDKKKGDNKRKVHINDTKDKKDTDKRQNSDNSNDRTKDKGDNDERVTKDSDQNRNKTKGSDTPRSSSETSEGRHKQKEFFKLELQRLETGLRRESSKIQAPTKKAYTPYVFNTLEPYYNTYTTRFLIELPDEVRHGHTSRRTAQGLTDPWLDLKMDTELPQVVSAKPVSRQVAILKREKELRDRKKRSGTAQSSKKGGGSTRLPKFPVVQLETKDLATKQLFYSDVPQLRHELKTKYSSSAKTKVAEDYERTQQDFYRMELNKLDEVHPINRKHMKSAYFAYLQNTPGSKKAINECVRGLKSGKA